MLNQLLTMSSYPLKYFGVWKNPHNNVLSGKLKISGLYVCVVWSSLNLRKIEPSILPKSKSVKMSFIWIPSVDGWPILGMWKLKLFSIGL